MSAGHRFHANDNTIAYLYDGGLDLLQAEVGECLQTVLRALIIDVEQDHNSRETARHVAKMFIREVFAGYYVEAPEVTMFPNAERLNELMVVGSLRVHSACSHHLCPVIGRMRIGVMPRQDPQLIGLSKYTQLIDWVMSHPQIQEETVKQIADLLEDRMGLDGLAAMLEAEHYCMHWYGMKDDKPRIVSSVVHGVLLTDASLWHEFLAPLPGRNGG